MEPELNRIKDDLATMRKAIGLAPSPGRAWLPWLKRDTRLLPLFCGPGALIILASLLLPAAGTGTFLGLVAAQWVGILVAALLLGILLIVKRRSGPEDGRPDGLVREYKRINRQLRVILPPIGLYFIWGAQHSVGREAFTAGLWILSGSLLGVTAFLAGPRVNYGWAIPMVTYGLCEPLLGSSFSGVWLGVLFIVSAALCTAIQKAELRRMEKAP